MTVSLPLRNLYQKTTGYLHTGLKEGNSIWALERLRKLCEEDKVDEAFKEAESMEGSLSKSAVYSLLQSCRKEKDLGRVQAIMIRGGMASDDFLASHLVRLYASYGNIGDANEAFAKVERPSVDAWAEIISANAKLGKGHKALDLYHKMQSAGVKRNRLLQMDFKMTLL